MRMIALLGATALAATLAGAAQAHDAEADAAIEADDDATPDDADESDAAGEGEQEPAGARPESEQQFGSSACSVSAPSATSAWWMGAVLAGVVLRRRSRR